MREYDQLKVADGMNSKQLDQRRETDSGAPTQNGKFVISIESFKSRVAKAEAVKCMKRFYQGCDL